MRATLPFAAVALVALVLLWALRPQSDAAPLTVATPPPTAVAPPDYPAPPAAPAPLRQAAVTQANGSITGHIVDSDGKPVAAASVTLVVDDAPSELTTQSGSDGRFLLAGAPDGAVAIRIEAPGFATAQRGDLHPDREPDRHLDVGTLTLHPAVLWHGLVLCDGRAVADAQVTLAPQLGRERDATPLVQHTRTDAQGAFVFAQGPQPAVVRVRCAGYREPRPREVADPRQDLRFDLVAVRRVTGRVVRAEDDAPLPNARIAVVALRDHIPGEIRARGDLPASPLAPDGSFDLELPEATLCFVEVIADGRVAQARGPFETTASVGPLTIPMPAGVVVLGTVTWRGDPMSGYAQLLPETGEGEAVATAEIRRDGRLRLPPAPPGRWLLRIGPLHGALQERLVDLQLPGPQSVEVTITEGTRLVGNVNGPLPNGPMVLCRHATGWTRSGPVQADGSFAVESLFPGTWTVFCEGRGGLAMAAEAMLQPLLEPRTVVVHSEAELRFGIDSPALRFGTLQGMVQSGGDPARIELVPTDPVQRRAPGNFLVQQADERGAFTLYPVLPGTWQVLLVRGELRRTANVVVTAGQTTTVTFPE